MTLFPYELEATVCETTVALWEEKNWTKYNSLLSLVKTVQEKNNNKTNK